MKIFAIVVTYNGVKWCNHCLGSLLNSEIPLETIVIDNASCDGTVEYVKKHFPEVYLIERKENLGFAKANNIGIRYAIDHDADYVFLLNQDAWVEYDTLTKLVQTFEDNEKVGIASPIHLNGSYSGLDHGFVNCLSGDFVSDLYMGRLKPYYELHFVNAAAWLLSADCIKSIGGFDTLLFKHYGEDNNYCQRIQYHNYRIIVNPHCTICHDREVRKNMIGQNPLWDQTNSMIWLKLEYGDINKRIDLDEKIKKLKLKRFLSIISCNISKAKKYKLLIGSYRTIMDSRNINIIKGQNWL